MTYFQDVPAPYLTTVEGTAPANPDTGDQKLFIDSANHHLKRVDSSGAVVDIEASAGGAAVYPQRAVLFGDDLSVVSGCGGALVTAMISTQKYGYGVNQVTPGNGDVIGASVLLKAGTYNFFALGYGEPDLGKINWVLDGTTFITAQDWYSGTSAPNTLKTGTLTVAQDGRHLLTATINGKNGSASNYYFYLTKIWFVATTETQEP